MANLSIPAGLLHGGALPAALMSVLLKAFLSGKDDTLSIVDLADRTASTEEEVEAALDELTALGKITKNDDKSWSDISTVVPSDICISLVVQQGRLTEDKPSRDKVGWDEWEDGDMKLRADVMTTGPTETPFCLTITDITESEPVEVVTQLFETNEAAWAWVDKYRGIVPPEPAPVEEFALADSKPEKPKAAPKKKAAK